MDGATDLLYMPIVSSVSTLLLLYSPSMCCFLLDRAVASVVQLCLVFLVSRVSWPGGVYSSWGPNLILEFFSESLLVVPPLLLFIFTYVFAEVLLSFSFVGEIWGAWNFLTLLHHLLRILSQDYQFSTSDCCSSWK